MKKKYVSPQKKRQKLKKKLWAILSDYVRARDAYTCITCGTRGEGSGIHCGHFIPSSICGLALRYDERNLAAQCFRCNIHLGGWGERFAEALERKHGKEFVEELRKARHTTTLEKDYDWEGKIKEYQEKLKQLI